MTAWTSTWTWIWAVLWTAVLLPAATAARTYVELALWYRQEGIVCNAQQVAEARGRSGDRQYLSVVIGRIWGLRMAFGYGTGSAT
jgi:hypothetical protein